MRSEKTNLKVRSNYLYGFNGQEKTDEISGNGNHTTAEFWEYDPRLGRRWNLDPIIKPWESSYLTLSGNPILLSDPFGDDPGEYTKDEKTGSVTKISDKGDAEGIDFIYTGSTVQSGAGKGGFIATRTDVMEKHTVGSLSFSSRSSSRTFNKNGTSKAAYVSYGWSAEQTDQFAKFGLSLSVGLMTGGMATGLGLGGSGLMASAGELGGAAIMRGAIDITAQAAVNGPNNIDYGDGAMAMLFNPKYAAVFGSLVDYKQPFSKESSLSVSGFNKSLTNTAIDLGTKSLFGGIGITGKAQPLLKQIDTPYLNAIFTAPINLGGKLVTKVLKDETK